MIRSHFPNFLTATQVDFQAGRTVWETANDLFYVSASLKACVIIPKLFRTDLASVPRFLLTWFIAGGRAPRPAVVHDYGYQTGYLIDANTFKPISLTRKKLDLIFDEAMEADPISGTSNAFIRNSMYYAVRLGGRKTWNDYRNRAAKLNPKWTAGGWPYVPREEKHA